MKNEKKKLTFIIFFSKKLYFEYIIKSVSILQGQLYLCVKRLKEVTYVLERGN